MPKKYVDKIQNEFREYYKKLKNDELELNKFFNVWKKQWEMKGNPTQRISGTVS